MPKIAYQAIDFVDWKIEIIDRAISIVDDYARQGYDLTLRQVYYQFVARDWLPARWADPKTGSTNNVMAYKKLGCILGDARLAGMMDWDSMVDRTREMGGNTHWSSPESIIGAVASQYAIDKWQDQPKRPEVWVEKDALEGVVSVVCKRLDVPYFSCRGYTSLTSIWQNAQRLKTIAEDGHKPVVLHLGDHDPSGIDMSRDIRERVCLFMGDYGSELEFERLALNMDQVRRYRPPENPAKSTDSRYKGYMAEHGEHSWELDALEPTVLSALITAAVERHRDNKLFKKMQARERKEKSLLEATKERWDDVVELVGGNGEAR
jgi:hypothetical protein